MKMGGLFSMEELSVPLPFAPFYFYCWLLLEDQSEPNIFLRVNCSSAYEFCESSILRKLMRSWSLEPILDYLATITSFSNWLI